MRRRPIIISVSAVVVLVVGATIFVILRERGVVVRPTAETPMHRIRGPSRSCRTCHRAIYDEWASSRHARAWLNPLFIELSENYSKTECLSCHAPDRLVTTGFGNLPDLRDKYLAEGVNCIACHEVSLNLMAGPYEMESQLGHANEKNELYRTSVSLCASCHGVRMVQGHNKVTEFRNSLFAQEDYTCGNCHMPLGERPLSISTGGIIRLSGDHRALGGRDLDLLKRAAEVSAVVQGGRLQVKVKSVRVGHFLPGGVETLPDVRLRSMLVDTQVRDDEGITVFQKRETLAKPLGTEIENRLRSDETRTYSYDLDLKSGEVTVTLLYKLYPDTTDEEAVVMAQTKISFK